MLRLGLILLLLDRVTLGHTGHNRFTVPVQRQWQDCPVAVGLNPPRGAATVQRGDPAPADCVQRCGVIMRRHGPSVVKNSKQL